MFKQFLLSLLLLSNFAFAGFGIEKLNDENANLHFSTFKSTFISPEIAKINNLTRSNHKHLINISIIEDNHSIDAEITGFVQNILGQQISLDFRKIIEPNAVYALADFKVDVQEKMKFVIIVKYKNKEEKITFFDEVFPDK